MVLIGGDRFPNLSPDFFSKQFQMSQAGQNIRSIRELKNLTQDYVAEHLHMSVSNYSNIENGKTDLTLTRLQQLASVFGVEYHQILNFNAAEIFPANGKPHAVTDNNFKSELVKQLQIKDEQINRLLSLLERFNI